MKSSMHRSNLALSLALAVMLAGTCMGIQIISGGWSPIDPDSPDLEEAYNYLWASGSMIGPSMQMNETAVPDPDTIVGSDDVPANNGTMEICAAQTQVVAGLNYFFSLAPDCAQGSASWQNVTIYRALDGSYNVTCMGDCYYA